MKIYEPKLLTQFKNQTWLVTGCAGLIASHLVENLLAENQQVIGIDNFITGSRKNIDLIKSCVSSEQLKNFEFLEGDLRDEKFCQSIVRPDQIILHQAALGSVSRSIDTPLATNAHNVNGFLNLLVAAKDAKVKRFVYASSSSVYGDHPELPKKEENVGEPRSPYAVTKKINELYAKNFGSIYGIETVGLRYFNVFGSRQDPMSAYAAVIPLWIKSLLKKEPIYINGDGETTRDFCYVRNVVQANFRAAICSPEGTSRVYNIAVGAQNTLNQLFTHLKKRVGKVAAYALEAQPVYRDFRLGDIRHSLADTTLAQKYLGYAPNYSLEQGLDETVPWFIENLMNS